MALSYELISQFAKLATSDKKTNNGTTVYGYVTLDDDGNKCVQPDGSNQLIPIAKDSTVTNVDNGQRVSVLIKDHTAIVTGNISSPSATTGEVKKLEGDITTIQEFDILVGQKIQAAEANISRLQTDKAEVGHLAAATAKITELEAKDVEITGKLTAAQADITDLRAKKIDADVVIADYAKVKDLDATNVEVNTIKGEQAEFREVTTKNFSAINADMVSLKTEKLDAESADIKYANIDFANVDFANIDKAKFGELYAASGIIENYISENGVVTGRLVAVSINADNIDAGSLKAERIMLQGDDGLFYKLNVDAMGRTIAEALPSDEQDQLMNGIHGKSIIAKSITADKVSVSDLVAFGAKIGGFTIANHSLHSNLKSSADNPTPGIYLDSKGQFNIGDGTNFFRYYQVPRASAVVSDDRVSVTEIIDKKTISAFVSNGVLEVVDSDVSPSTTARIIDDVLDVTDNTYKLEISADSILFGAGSKSSASDLKALTEHVKIGTEVLSSTVYEVTYDDEAEKYIASTKTIDTPSDGVLNGEYTTDKRPVYVTGDGKFYCLDEKPCIELSEGDSDFKQVITNVETRFMDGDTVKTKIDTDGIHTDDVTVNGESRYTNPEASGQWVWAVRPNGNFGLTWKG